MLLSIGSSSDFNSFLLTKKTDSKHKLSNIKTTLPFGKIDSVENSCSSKLSGISSQKPELFNFRHEMIAIKTNVSVVDKDKALSRRFSTIVNPKKIIDGHCASCAWNTHLHLVGKKLVEARRPNGGYHTFGQWIFDKYTAHFNDIIVEPENGDIYKTLKDKLIQKLLQTTKEGEAVLLSVSEGSHWFNAYNDGERIWLIDSQKGRGFNLSDIRVFSLDEKVDLWDVISIIKVEDKDIEEYYKKFQ